MSHERIGFGWSVCFDRWPSGVVSGPDSEDFCFANVPKCPKMSQKYKSLMSQNLSRNVPKCPKHCWNVPKLEKGQCFVIVFVI